MSAGRAEERPGFDPGTVARRVRADLEEFFFLRQAEERARRIADDEVAALDRALSLADQKREAAELLFQSSARAEALKTIHEAFALLDALPAAEDAAKEIDRAQLRADSRGLPALETEIEERHEALFRRLVDAEASLARDLEPLAVGVVGRKALRFERIGVAVAAVALLCVLGIWWARRSVITAEASATWGGKYEASNAVDGQETTHWLLPDMATGWLDLHLKPARKVTMVSMLNAYDPPSYGVLEYRLEARVGNRIVKVQDGTLAGTTAFGVKPQWVHVGFVTDQKVDTVRIVIKTHRDLGAGFAEVDVH